MVGCGLDSYLRDAPHSACHNSAGLTAGDGRYAEEADQSKAEQHFDVMEYR